MFNILEGTTPYLIVFTTICFLLYRYLVKYQNFWESQDIPVVKKHFIFGSFNAVFLKPLHIEDLENCKKYGKIFGRYDGQTPILVVSDPEILKLIMVKDFHVFPNRRYIKFGDVIADNNVALMEGKDWKRVRSVVSALATSSKLRKMLYLIDECTKSLNENLSDAAKYGKSIDITSFCNAFVVDVIATTAFGTKINSHKNPNNPFVSKASILFTSGFSWRMYMTVLFPQVMKFFKISLFNPEGINFFQQFVQQAIENRKKTGEVRFDFLQLVLDAENTSCTENHIASTEKSSDIKTLTPNEVVSQCCGFFIAGYHSSSSTLSSVFYNLATHPDCQDKLIQEIDSTLQNNEIIEYDILNKMNYLDAVISETLRIYPPAVRIERQAVSDYTLENLNINVKKGMLINIPVFAIHHDPEVYPDPEEFDPERFIDEGKTSHHFTYFAFGEGPRNCVGRRFALMLLKLCIVKTLQKFRFSPGPEIKIPPKINSSYALLKLENLMLKVEERSDK